MKASTAVPVTAEVAEQIADGRRDAVEFLAAAHEGIDRLAATRSRHRSGDAELTEARPTAFGVVELVFLAETEAD